MYWKGVVIDMKRKFLHPTALICVLLFTVALLTGCSELDYGGVDRDLVIEYCVNAVINHDRNYIIKLQDREPEEETTTVWISDDPEEPTSGANGGDGSGTSPNGGSSSSSVTMSEAMSVSGYTFESSGYSVADVYPEGNEGFSMVAVNGQALLILKFNVTNVSGEENLDFSDLGYRYRCTVNSGTRVNVQKTALINALNTWDGSLGKGEKKEMVLVFQVSEEISNNINNISLSIIKDGKSSTVTIK